MSEWIEYRGFNGTLVLNENALTIKRGWRWFMFNGFALRGDKTIPYANIAAIQFRKGGLMAGYIQFTIKGWGEAKLGIFQASTDENTITFIYNHNAAFSAAKEFIERKISELPITETPTHTLPEKENDYIEEIERLAILKEKGLITEEEFNAKKKILLG